MEKCKELLSRHENGFKRTDKDTVREIWDFNLPYMDFLNQSKTEREAIQSAVQLALAEGFRPFEEDIPLRAGDKIFYNNRGKALILAVIGEKGCREGVRIAAAHIDSPRLDLKPIPLYEASELALFKTHYYGGIKKYQWTATPLSMHGKVIRRDGSAVDICIGEKEGDPQFCITDLLPHLSQEQSAKTLGKAIEGEDLNILIGSEPLPDYEEKDAVKLHVLKLLHEEYGITEDDLVSAEIEFVPAAKAAEIGFDRSMIGSYGHDDRVCAYPALQAIFGCGVPEKTCITVLCDKEETGSDGNTGLNSRYLEYFIKELAHVDGVPAHRVLQQSECLSADVTAAFDPTYASAYEPSNACYLNKGVGVCKYTGARGKGGTSDCSAEFLGKIRRLLEDKGVVWQIGELGRVDLGGGGTVAKFIANLGADVLDIGVPVLSMHAPFEVVSKLDVFMAYRAFAEFFAMVEGE